MKFLSRRNFRNYKTSIVLLLGKEARNGNIVLKPKSPNHRYFTEIRLFEVLKLLKFFQVKNFIGGEKA